MLQRYDARILGDLVADDGTRVSSGALATDTNLTTALEDASGQILLACHVGARYTEADLSGLSGNSASYLERLTCDLAFAYLRQRRGYDVEQFLNVRESFNILDRLRLGERVFDVANVKNAGNPSAEAIPTNVFSNQNFVRDYASRFYPNRRHTTDQ